MATTRITRRKLADYTARELTLGNASQAIKALAMFLVETKRVRELDLIVRDIEYALYEHGETIVDVTSSKALAETLRKEIASMAKANSGATKVHLREHVDSAVIGGVRLEYGQQRLDMTLRHKLNKLKAEQI